MSDIGTAVVGIAVLAGIVFVAMHFDLGKYLQVVPAAADVQKQYPNTNANLPLNLGPLTLGQTVTATQYQKAIQNIPVIGNPLGYVFTSGYGAGVAVGSAIQGAANAVSGAIKAVESISIPLPAINL